MCGDHRPLSGIVEGERGQRPSRRGVQLRSVRGDLARLDPEYWRNIHLVTVRDEPQSHIVGALVHEAMRTEWANEGASPVNAHLAAN